MSVGVSISIEKSLPYQISPDETEKRSFVTAATNFLITETSVTCSHRALNIQFKCERRSSQVHQSVYHVYRACIQNLTHSLMSSNPNNCVGNAVSGHCGHFRGHLSECRCKALDRKSNPIIRKVYEDRVIKEALAIIAAQTLPFDLRLGIFASGGLHGEQVLLFRLLEEIKRRNMVGTIKLFLIDTDYQSHIRQSGMFHENMRSQGHAPWDELIGFRKDLKQFLLELSFCLPSTIIVEGYVFGDSADYTTASQADKAYQHDLLIGADIERNENIMRDIDLLSRRSKVAPIVLVKEGHPGQEVAKVCEIPVYLEKECIVVKPQPVDTHLTQFTYSRRY